MPVITDHLIADQGRAVSRRDRRAARGRARGAAVLAVSAAAVATLALGLGGAQTARASGFQLKEQSSEGLGNAYAGSTAKAYDPSTVFFNPAGMTRLDGHTLAAEAAYIMPRAHFSGAGTTAFGTPTGGGLGGDAAMDTLLPSMYGVFSVTDDLKLGLAVNVPFGMSTDYDPSWTGRYQALESYLQAMAIQPTIAYRVNSHLSIGGGPIFQYTDVRLSTGINNLGLLPYDGINKLTGSDLGFGFTLGALWEFNEGSRVGINYRSRVHHTFDGETRYSNVHPGLALAGGLVDSDATAELTTPDVVSLGLYHEFTDSWAGVAEVSWTHWSLFDELAVDADVGADSTTAEDWEDTVFASIGAIYRPNDAWTIRLGAAYDMSPVPDNRRTARIPDADRYWLSAGVSYAVDDWLHINAGYTHIFVEDASLTETTSQGSLVGSYSNGIDILTLGGSLRF